MPLLHAIQALKEKYVQAAVEILAALEVARIPASYTDPSDDLYSLTWLVRLGLSNLYCTSSQTLHGPQAVERVKVAFAMHIWFCKCKPEFFWLLFVTLLFCYFHFLHNMRGPVEASCVP